jgi:hypothetical protein
MADDIVEVFHEAHDLALTLRSLGYLLRRYRKAHGRSEPPDPSIRCQLQRHCSQCDQYQGKEDLFYSPNPGIWKLRAKK